MFSTDFLVEDVTEEYLTLSKAKLEMWLTLYHCPSNTANAVYLYKRTVLKASYPIALCGDIFIGSYMLCGIE